VLEFDRVPVEFARRYRREGYWRGEVLGELLRDWAQKDPGRVAIIEGDRRWSYAELNAKVDRVSAGLRKLGIAPHDTVVVQLPNVVSFPIVTIALFRLGAVPVFALPTFRRSEIVYLSEYSEAVAYVICDVHFGFDYRALAREVLGSVSHLQHVIVDGDAEEFKSLAGIEAEPQPLEPPHPSNVAFFLLSGGTTGLPKLIPRTHDDYAYQLRATADGLRFGEHSVYLAALPVAHNAALGCPGLLGALHAGGKVVLLGSPSADDAFSVVEREGVTLTTLMPPLVLHWLEAAEFCEVNFSRLLLQVGSARFAPELARRVRTELGCRLTHWFGMAEGLLTFTRLDDPDDVIDYSQGRPLSPADEIRVVDEDGAEVRPGEVGELLTRGPYTLRGYYKAAKHNAATFTADGFLRTGDLVRITPEGNMVVEGRRKDVINRGGEKVSAGEVEDLLLTHPKVREVAVVAMPDELMGEKTCAFVRPGQEAPDLKELRDFLRQHGLADYKLPDRVEIVASLPQTKVGKINKVELREMIAAKLQPLSGPPNRSYNSLPRDRIHGP
jgi:2,3-dihydroxybenzoate-AMP ligase